MGRLFEMPSLWSAAVTLTPEAKAELFKKLEGTMGVRMKRVFERSMLGDVEWDHDLWSGILDWIEGPLRLSMLYGPDVDPNQRGEHNPAYKSFEAFDRARLQGILDKGQMVNVMLSAVKELQDFETDALTFLKVRFTPPKEPESGA
jgi:hypothetical protein